MRVLSVAVAFFAAVITSNAYAQAVPNIKAFTSSGEIAALIAKVKAEIKDGQAMKLEPVLSLAPYRALLEYRVAVAPASLHEKSAEVMYVIEGTGTLVTGGKLVDEKRTNAANLSGTSIVDGASQALAKGDILIIPENTPHQVTPAGGAPIILISLHVPRPTPWP